MDFLYDPGLALHLPLYEMDGAAFNSKDAYGHLATVTGALWRLDGRLFDGVDDRITVPSHSSFENLFDGGGTIAAVFNPSSDGENDSGVIVETGYSPEVKGWEVRLSSEAAGFVKVVFGHRFTLSSGGWASSDAVFPIGSKSLIMVTYNADSTGNTPVFYHNGVSIGITTSSPLGTRKSDAGEDIRVGSNSDGTRAFDGVISEVRAFSRMLSPLEIQQDYLATKRRYR